MKNTLINVTKNEILERLMLGRASKYDSMLLRAIEVYSTEQTIYSKATSFISELAPIFIENEKESYISIFKEYLEIESGIEAFTTKYTSHVNHVIQEFLLGYNILQSSQFIIENFIQDDTARNDLLFSWTVAALFHDIGYDIEKFNEEEQFRKKKNEYWSFLRKRPTLDEPMDLRMRDDLIGKVNENILRRFNQYYAKEISFPNFLKLFEYKETYDHAFISCLKYYEELIRLQNNNGGNYLNWEPNYNAIFTILLHNYKHKSDNILLSARNDKHILPYLLMLCDEIEYWERDRVLQRDSNEDIVELQCASFKNDYSFFIVNHSSRSDIDEYSLKLIMKVIENNKRYPFKLIKSPVLDRLYDELEEKYSKNLSTIMERQYYLYLYDNKYRSPFEVGVDKIYENYKIDSEIKENKDTIEKFINEPKILLPSNEYRIIIEQRVNNKPVITYELGL